MLLRSAALLSLFAGLTASVGAAVTAAPTPEQLDFFEKQVRPILVDRCYECHSTGKKTKGGLALDTQSSTLKGGDTGLAVVPGNPEKSLLIEAVRYQNHDLQMPPKKQLSAAEIKALEDWVKMGAPDPRTAPVAVATGNHPKGMALEDGRKFWSFAPLARVEPPKVAEGTNPIDAFIRAKLAEKNLSPAPPTDKRTLLRRATFDLTGLPPTPQEVEDFLADTKPDAFDRVIERLLASPHYGERWGRHWLDVARYADSNGLDENIAFGNAWRYRDYVVKAFNDDKPYDQFIIEQVAGDLLGTGPEAITATGFLSIGARVLAEPDVQKLEMDIIDEQLDTIGKSMLGMTFGCARCHDHKFDPVTQEDYYAMAAIFRSTRSLSTEKMGAIKFWYEHSMAKPEETEAKKKYDEKVKAKKAEIAAFTKKARDTVKATVQEKAADYLAAAAQLPASATIADAGKVAGLNPKIVLSVRQYLDEHRDAEFFAHWRELGANSDALRAYYQPLFDEALKTKKGPAFDALNDAKGFLVLPVKDADVLDAATVAQIETMTKAATDLEAAAPELPGIMSVADGNVVKTLPVHLRGSYLTLGKPVERGFPEVMRTSITRPIMPAKHSGRLELARWLASSDHPLTARVMVNRVWRWHFGQGIVTTTDNFGVLGGRPSHPELLDWLARNFIESGWSIKDLHRLIMKSATYQQSSSVPISGPEHSDPHTIDPENRLLWRANIQRLEAEQIRDAMLSASGWLDLTIGGKTIPLKNREFVFNHTSKDATTYESPRRALYLPIIRNHLYDMLEQFDYPDPTMPTGSRNSTVIAPQALIMMNAPVVMDSAAKLAKRLTPLPEDRRLEELYELLYGRSVSEREKTEALDLVRDLTQTESPERAWTLLCQTLLAANEFIYLR